MGSREKTLKERLPHTAIKEIAEIVGVSVPVVSRVVNGNVKFRRADGREVRICSEDMESKIIRYCEQYAEKWEKVRSSLQTMDC
jgi:NADH:ubiquinone oxidoreductase subunit E